MHLASTTLRRALSLAAVVTLSWSASGQSFSGLEFRSIDGIGNNLTNPDFGSAGITLMRQTTNSYGDLVSTPAGATRPSARAVSNAVCAQSGSVPNSAGASDMFWLWGQFVDHDIDLTPGASPQEPFDIAVPLGDIYFDPGNTGTQVIPLDRSIHDGAVGGVREQLNEITSFIDGSNVYGSDPARASELRSFSGKLKISSGGLLPFNVNGFPNAPADNDPSFFLAGDIRANEHNGLTAMHTVWVREHNLWAGVFGLTGLPGEMRYQMARMVIGAEMQAITYNEFVPLLLGPGSLPPYSGYDSNVDPAVSNLFSTVCYRFGHTMLSPTLLRVRKNGTPINHGNIELRDAFFNPFEVQLFGIDALLRGFVFQQAQEIDPLIIDDVRNFLFGPPGSGGFDLASLNMQRGRDHGLPGYNQARVDFGLAPRATFAEVTSDPTRQAALASVYASVNDIDAWVGGLSEDHVSGAMVGELFWHVMRDQFLRMRDGDRFYFQNSLPPSLLAIVSNTRLSTVLRRNTRLGLEIPDNAFVAPAP